MKAKKETIPNRAQTFFVSEDKPASVSVLRLHDSMHQKVGPRFEMLSNFYTLPVPKIFYKNLST